MLAVSRQLFMTLFLNQMRFVRKCECLDFGESIRQVTPSALLFSGGGFHFYTSAAYDSGQALKPQPQIHH